jgi:hypothetical protein
LASRPPSDTLNFNSLRTYEVDFNFSFGKQISQRSRSQSKDRKYNPALVLLKPEACNKIKVSFAPQKRIKERYGKVKETVKHKHLPPQNPMQPVETWIALVHTRNAEENETLSRSLFKKMIPHRRLQTHSQRCCPQFTLPIGPH